MIWVPFDGFQLKDCSLQEVKKTSIPKIVFLLPYCLKPLDCKYRKKNFCDSTCTRKTCVYGKITRFLQEQRIKFFQITSYEHLEKTINEQKENFSLFVGLTCNPFPYTKILQDLKCVNILVYGNTCFKVSQDLRKIISNKEFFDDAKKGNFKKESQIDFEQFLRIFNELFMDK
ncbi:MAG: hypothetical protein PWP03_822 [Candidatus Woesearchaeota archaeon]|nr:hypothetical protein [Candidatus Woesearchaeota archaeon]